MLRNDVDKEAVRRLVVGQRAAERRAFALMREEGPMSPEASFTAAMELCSLVALPEHDPVRDKEVEVTRAIWAKLKRRWAAKHA